MQSPPRVRNLSRAEVTALRLLERARSVAVVGRPDATVVGYLRRAGYDVRRAPEGGPADLPGAVDLVVVFGRPQNVPALLEQAAAKGADGAWFFQDVLDSRSRTLARRLGLGVVVDPHLIERHRERRREAGQALKLGVRPRRRGRSDAAEGRLHSPGGWAEAGGGGARGGGGGRAVIDEKKMVRGRPGRRGRRRAFRGPQTA
ncbi:MAG TPA: CoA-binding protein [Candidatus Binatia bacterium]|nr:CoA-binding protein [Candidatus Binatia bacterium]